MPLWCPGWKGGGEIRIYGNYSKISLSVKTIIMSWISGRNEIRIYGNYSEISLSIKTIILLWISNRNEIRIDGNFGKICPESKGYYFVFYRS